RLLPADPRLLVELLFELGQRVVDRALVLELAQLPLGIRIAAVALGHLAVEVGLRLDLIDARRHPLEIGKRAGAGRDRVGASALGGTRLLLERAAPRLDLGHTL